jgi:TonB family protein
MDILTSTVAEGAVRPAIDGALVYRRSSRGVVKLSATDGGQLSALERQVLIMVDGRRTLAELAELFAPKKLRLLSVLADLESKGLVKRVDPRAGHSAGAITQFATTRLDTARSKAATDLPVASGPAWLVEAAPAQDRRPKRFPPPAVITARTREPAARRFTVEEHPLAWFGISLLLTIACSNWLANRFRADVQHAWWSDYRPIQWADAPASRETTSALASTLPVQPSPIRTAPVAHPAKVAPPAAAPRPASNAPARATPRTTPHVQAGATVESRATPPASHTVATVAQASVEETSAPPARAPADPAPAPAPAPDVRAAAPAAPAATAPSESPGPRPLSHDPPRIPQQAVQQGVVEGHAQVRLWITPEGKVDQVDVLEASPPNVLNDEVKRALSLWTFEPPGHPMDQVLQLTLEP